MTDWDGTTWAGDPVDLSTRAIDSFADAPGLTEQLLAAQGLRSQPFRAVSVNELLSVPSIERAVTLIAGLTGSLPLLAYRNGAPLIPTPRIVARPDPFCTARNFGFGVGWNLATRGEAILYAAAIDGDGAPVSILNLPLHEVEVTWRDDLELVRKYTWRGRELDSARVQHVFYVYRTGELRGLGPLQLVGAAFSVAVEADEWAARYFGEGGLTSVHLHSEAKLSDPEADLIKQRWIDQRSSVRVTSGGVLGASNLGINPQDSQLTESRMFGRGEAAVAFGIPGKLLEYAASGSSLTYENVGEVMTDFARATLSPMYLIPIEQAITDFLTRSTVARFDLDQLQRADPKSRYEVHAIAIDKGIYPPEYAAMIEGITPGAVVTAPAPPAATESVPVPSAQGAALGSVTIQ